MLAPLYALHPHEKAKFSNVVGPPLLRGRIWSASKGCVEKAAGLRQYSQYHWARSATWRLNRRDGCLEGTEVVCQSQVAHERPDICTALLRQRRKGLETRDIHSLHTLPECLEFFGLGRSQRFCLAFTP